jgi:hypothetical protein
MSQSHVTGHITTQLYRAVNRIPLQRAADERGIAPISLLLARPGCYNGSWSLRRDHSDPEKCSWGALLRVFIAGVMQASSLEKGIVDQQYRSEIRAVLLARWPELEVVDPFELHPRSVEYPDDEAKETLFSMIELARSSDLVIAYAPVASMGTALEMYAAYLHNVPVLTISPMVDNWVVRALSRRVLADLASFSEFVALADSPAALS